MTAVKNVKEIIAQFSQDLDLLGVNYTINHSQTDFGSSSYIYVGPYKLRSSDHSIGHLRMREEECLHPLTYKSVLEKVERYFFPERFEMVEQMEFGDAHFKNIENINGFEFKILDESKTFTSKKGNLMHYVAIKNKKVISYQRK